MKNQKNGNRGVGGYHVSVFGRPTFLMAPEKGKGGGGGEDPGEDEDALPKTKTELAALIADAVGKTVNSLVTDRLKRDATKRATEMDAAIAKALAAAGVKPTEDPGEGGGEGDPAKVKQQPPAGGASKVPPEVEAALKSAQRIAAEAKKMAEDEKAARIKAERRAELDEAKSKLQAALVGKVRPEQIEDVVELLTPRLTRDPESKKILWKGEGYNDAEGADNSGAVLTFEDGLKSWEEKKGKHYAPARTAGGGGTGPAGNGGRLPTGKDHVATDAEIGSLLFNRRQ